MNITSNQIQTYENLRRQVATLGMVLSGIRVGQEVPGRDRYLTVGLEMCDIVAKRGRLGAHPVSQTYEEAAFIDRFYRSPPETPLQCPETFSTLEEQALRTRRVLERLLHLEKVPAADVAQCSDFCHEVYNAL